jgi:hypothetical protein
MIISQGYGLSLVRRGKARHLGYASRYPRFQLYFAVLQRTDMDRVDRYLVPHNSAELRKIKEAKSCG